MTSRSLPVGCFALLVLLAACNRPQSQDDLARNNPPPTPQAQATPAQRPGYPNTSPAAQLPTQNDTQVPASSSAQNSYRSAQETYRAALNKAESDHKAAVDHCRTLAKAARNSCKDDADTKLKMAKSEAERLKPAS